MSAARPVRLAVYTDSSIVAGSERLLTGLLPELGPHVDVTVIGVHRDVVRTVAATRPGTRFAVVPKIHTKAHLPAMLRFARTVAAARPDVLQITLTTPWSCRAETFVGLALPGVRTVLFHTLPLEPDHSWVRLVARELARRADARVAVGVLAAREVERQVGLPRGSVRTIESAVEAFTGVRDGAPRGRPRIGTIARLDRQKGLDLLLRALPRLPQVDVEIVGDGSERMALEALAGALGIADRVTFAGWSDQTRDWLARWDAFVLPSRYEGLPLAVLEAMLAGLPVVAADVGSMREAVQDGVTGLLVPPEDPPALGTAVRRLLDDAALARELGRQGRALALARFTTGAMARRFEELYEELLSR